MTYLLKNTFSVKLTTRDVIKPIIEKWHYSHSINGVQGTYYFGLYNQDELIGGMIFGGLAMANQWKKYTNDKSKIIELRRLACIDNTPQNTESFFIGRAIRWIKQNTPIEVIISYADSNFGHTGAIYKATNFKYSGLTATGRVILYNGKRYHDKTIRTKYKGIIKPFALRVKQALSDGTAKYVPQQGKHIYLFNL